MTGIRINKSGFGVFDITVDGASKDLTNKIHELAAQDIGLLPPKYVEDSTLYVNVQAMPNFQHKALFRAAQLYFAADDNKINTIKFIRSITNTAPLLEAKQLVDYALGGVKPSWFKDEY